MKKEIIFVSKIRSEELFKCPKAYMDNNPLIVTRFNLASGKRIGTRVGNDLSKLVSTDHADYYYIEDLDVHDCEKLEPEDITAFLLANSGKSINALANKGDIFKGDIKLIVFDFLLDESSLTDIEKRKIKSFK